MKESIKKYLKSNLNYLHFFYSVLRMRLFFVFLISILFSLIDAVSLSMFIPLFQIATNETSAADNNDFFLKAVHFFNINPTVNTVLLIMLLSFFLKAALRYTDVYYRVLATSYFVKKIRGNLLAAIANLRYSKFVSVNFGTIQNSVTTEIHSVNSAFSQYISVMQNVIFVLVYIGLSFLTNPKFTSIIIVGGWLSRYLFKPLYKSSESISYEVAQKNNKLSGLVLQQLTNYKYLKSSALMQNYLVKINSVVDDIERKNIILGRTSAKVMSVREPIIVIFLVVAIYLQINVFEGKFSSIIIVLLFFYRAFGSLMTVQQSWTAFLKYVGSVNHYIRIMDEFKSESETPKGKPFMHFEDKISMQEVVYRYDNATNIVDSVSFDIPKNKTVALVGKSGSGKTTLVNLISTLLQPVSGKILIDGTDLTQYNAGTYRSKIGFISQETVVFNDTLFNNITFWQEKNQANLERFRQVIQKVDLQEFIDKSPLKEDTILGDNGVAMSGGQRQRLSIARELYKEIEILILDEATSSLDSQTERFIQDSIEGLKGQITIIVIAHRLSTIKNADTIIVIENGKVTGQGSYDELLSSSEEFSRMVLLQEL